MKAKKKTHLLRNSIVILAICAIIGLALTAVLFTRNPSPTAATATLQFTFDGAADGIAPNGSAFDISGIASNDVLSGALRTLSLDQTYKPEDLRLNLVAQGVFPEDMAAQVMNYESLLNFTANRELNVGDFHPTTFNIALYNGFDPSISQSSLEALMKAIMEEYQKYFAKTCANGLSTGMMIFDLDKYDYPQQLDIIQGRLNMMAQYAQEMYEKEPTFRYEGSGFNDISVRLNNLIDSDIARLNADLTMNALTRDTARLLTQYQYEIRDLSNQLEKQTQRLNKMDTLIASYEKNEIIYLSTTDSLTKIDGNSSETYDTLVADRKEVADGITEINSQIDTYQLKLSDLLKEDASRKPAATAQPQTATPADGQEPAAEGSDGEKAAAVEEVVSMTEEEIAAAAEEAERQAKAQIAVLESDIESLVSRGNGIIDDFSAMLQAYNGQEINELTVAVSRYDFEKPSIIKFAKLAIKTAGPICAIGFMLCMVMVIRRRKKEER